jgi:hypothetical protein
MKLRTFAAACAALVSLSATAALASEPVTAKLQQPVAQPIKFIAGGAVFQCAGDTCTAGAATSQTYDTSTCKTVAARVGLVTQFGDHRKFSDSRLAACNASAQAKPAADTLARK